jgi:hypothetical protein
MKTPDSSPPRVVTIGIHQSPCAPMVSFRVPPSSGSMGGRYPAMPSSRSCCATPSIHRNSWALSAPTTPSSTVSRSIRRCIRGESVALTIPWGPPRYLYRIQDYIAVGALSSAGTRRS